MLKTTIRTLTMDKGGWLLFGMTEGLHSYPALRDCSEPTKSTPSNQSTLPHYLKRRSHPLPLSVAHPLLTFLPIPCSGTPFRSNQATAGQERRTFLHPFSQLRVAALAIHHLGDRRELLPIRYVPDKFPLSRCSHLHYRTDKILVRST